MWRLGEEVFERTDLSCSGVSEMRRDHLWRPHPQQVPPTPSRVCCYLLEAQKVELSLTGWAQLRAAAPGSLFLSLSGPVLLWEHQQES